MTERDRYIAGVPCWVDAGFPDPKAATDFYAGMFGWEFEDTMPADAPGHYFIGRIGGRDAAAVGTNPDGPASQPSWNTYVWVDNADATTAA
ncbi:MAG: VOC family protein, partial [Acidimicrobiales bacterium]